jgi:hypothetical protein
MNLKMDLNWKVFVKKAGAINYADCYFNFLGRKSRWLIFVSIFMVAGFSGHIWYKYVYNPGWNDEQKKAYINSKDKGTVFNKSRFDGIISNQDKRRNNYDKKIEEVQDIFKLGEREIK